MRAAKPLAVLLCAALTWTAAEPGFALAIMIDGGGYSARETAAPASIDLSKTLKQLGTLSPSQQLARLGELSAADPAARNVAAVVLRPELMALRRADLEARLGPAQLNELAALAVGLHIEARSDEQVLAGLETLARQVAPEGHLEMLDLGRWFDGKGQRSALTAAGAGGSRLSPATVWPVEDRSTYKRRLHTLSSENGQVLIDGKPAEPLRESETQDDVVKETLLHPNDPGLLVRLYHSPNSMGGFERKNSKIENLAPLSAAGAAPKLIEHGEAVVDGKGRVYFYVQELAKGLALQDLKPEERPLEAVAELFERLARAGLALIVPGPNQAWLLSNIMLGATASGGSQAYLLDGNVETADAEQLAAHYDMLLAVLYPGQTRESARKAPASAAKAAPAYAPQLVERFATLDAGDDMRVVQVKAAQLQVPGVLREVTEALWPEQGWENPLRRFERTVPA